MTIYEFMEKMGEYEKFYISVAGKDITNDVELKEFFQDPTSVQQKVLIINDILASQLAAKQSFDIPVFGYKVELGKK